MRRICVLTGTRAEYGLLKPIMTEIKNAVDLDLSIIVTGMHLSKEFGYSVNEITKDGFTITARVEMNPAEDTGFSMATSIGKGIIGISTALRKIKPDVLLILGDRIEALAGAIAAAYMNIPIAHIHGGDSTRAGLDESARHAITKFAHIHFPATKKSAERIIKMGEDKRMVFVVGAPCLDVIKKQKFLTRKGVGKKFKIDLKKPLILLTQHSISIEPEEAEKQIIETLRAIQELAFRTIIIYPNSDAGGRKIIKQIKKYENLPFIQSYKNLSQKDYLNLLKYTSVMVGNSSSGIIESPAFKVPFVNIGKRQEERERADNVIDVNYDKNEIICAIKRALYDKDFMQNVKNCKNPYGDGKAAARIVKVLKKVEISSSLLQKKIAY